jgi:hypothetical protein
VAYVFEEPGEIAIHDDRRLTYRRPAPAGGRSSGRSSGTPRASRTAGCSSGRCPRWPCSTATDALNHGFRPQVVRQACADRSPDLHENNLADLDAKYADVVDLDDAAARLRG